MAELTLHISDELAERLKPITQQLPTLLEQVLADNLKANDIASIEPGISSNVLVYTEVLDFLLTRPTPQQVMAYKVSDYAQDRLKELLSKNREASLSSEEIQELDTYEQLEHLMILLKAQVESQQQSVQSVEGVNLLQTWLDDDDIEEQKETGDFLIHALDENRTSDRELFPLSMKGVSWWVRLFF